MLQRFHGRPNWAQPALPQTSKIIIFMTALLILLAIGVYQTTDTVSLPVQLIHDQAVVPVTPEDHAANSTLGVGCPWPLKF